jgi:hypothetical protein
MSFSKSDFYSYLKKHEYTVKEYVEYLNDWNELKKKGVIKDRWDYLEYYNKRDTQIMRPMIDNLIQNMWADKVDMLKNFSLAANASALKYAMAYDDFDINADYSCEEENNLPPFELSMGTWKTMCSRYRKQDVKACRAINDNVNAKHYEKYRELFRGCCHICNKRFTSILTPTLDRINCKISHTEKNVKPCCVLCNKSRSDQDLDMVKMQEKT